MNWLCCALFLLTISAAYGQQHAKTLIHTTDNAPEIEFEGEFYTLEQAIDKKGGKLTYSKDDQRYFVTFSKGEKVSFTAGELSSGEAFYKIVPLSVRVDFKFEKSLPLATLYIDGAGPVKNCKTNNKGGGQCYTYTTSSDEKKEIKLKNKRKHIFTKNNVSEQKNFKCTGVKKFKCES